MLGLVQKGLLKLIFFIFDLNLNFVFNFFSNFIRSHAILIQKKSVIFTTSISMIVINKIFVLLYGLRLLNKLKKVIIKFLII